MSKKLTLAGRYQNPVIRSHLASQYALGTLSSKVHQRVTQLMQIDDSLAREIFQWQNQLEPINQQIDEIKPPKKVWQKLSHELAFNKAGSAWWQSLYVWQGATAFSFFLILGLFIWQPLIKDSVESSIVQLQGPSYLAVLSPNLTSELDKPTASKKPLPELIISAYKSPQAGQSELHIQWNKNTSDIEKFEFTETQKITLWAIDKNSGKQVALGPLISTNNKQKLSVAQWKLIKNSKELWLTKGDQMDDPVLFKGECLQLSNWQKT